MVLRQISCLSPTPETVETEEDRSNIASQEQLPSSSYKQEILCSLPAPTKQENNVERERTDAKASLSYKDAVAIVNAWWNGEVNLQHNLAREVFL